MIPNSQEAFQTIVDCLKRYNYRRIQYFPAGRSRYLGREFQIIRSFLFKNNVNLFRTSGLTKLYERRMHNTSTELYNLYRFFFRCEEFPSTLLLTFLDQDELNLLTKAKIITNKNDRYISNYRFIPIENWFITCSPPREYDTDKYVHLGEDTITLWNLLKNECKGSIKNVLEIGCGAGFLSLWMSQLAQSVTATDINQRALEFTNLNAEINCINNIATKNSDVYSDIQGKFSLIFSNPPYMFLPDAYNERIFSYGGYLGMDILKKILLGLDEYLDDHGIALITALSYIKTNGTNTIYETLEQLFYGKPFSITLTQIDYHPRTKFVAFYEKHGISHSIRYLIKIRRAPTYKVKHLSISGISRVIENFRLLLLSRSKDDT